MKKTLMILAAATFLVAAAPQKTEAPNRFLPVVGNWIVTRDGNRAVMQVDGRQWIKGQPSAGLASNARRIYGARHEEFIDSVKAYAYFPYAVARDVDNFRNGEISISFRMIAGQLDQCAGILFNLKPNGDYLTVRFNGKEDNLVLWTFQSGKRSFVKKGTRDVHLAMGEWHRMKIAVDGTQLRGYLDDQLLLEYTLPAPVDGKVGLWSKTDSVSQFADFAVAAK
ncbi:MAG TPA: LamG domain-containing protein [Thermoanaerobaculia bacterium]|nr:LamG domain-containing protein [Thermoanaerobaculia bacterium]